MKNCENEIEKNEEIKEYSKNHNIEKVEQSKKNKNKELLNESYNENDSSYFFEKNDEVSKNESKNISNDYKNKHNNNDKKQIINNIINLNNNNAISNYFIWKDIILQVLCDNSLFKLIYKKISGASHVLYTLSKCLSLCC